MLRIAVNRLEQSNDRVAIDRVGDDDDGVASLKRGNLDRFGHETRDRVIRLGLVQADGLDDLSCCVRRDVLQLDDEDAMPCGRGQCIELINCLLDFSKQGRGAGDHETIARRIDLDGQRLICLRSLGLEGFGDGGGDTGGRRSRQSQHVDRKTLIGRLLLESNGQRPDLGELILFSPHDDRVGG